MTRYWRWLCALLMASVLVACGGGSSSDSGNAGGKAKTTLLVYFLASDLLNGRGAERDLENMLNAKNSKDINVVLQIGGGKYNGKFAGVNMKETKRYRLVPVANSSTGWTLEALPAAQQPAQVAMNKPQTLSDFMKWGASAFPAEKYAISLWDHGGGPILGFGQDLSLGGGTMLTLNEITSAFKDSGVKFELAGFDACLMASLEVASVLSPYVNFLVASEDITTGWQWTEVVNFLAANPAATGDKLGTAIVQSYKNFDDDTSGKGEGLDFTAYSVMNLQRVPALVSVMEKIATTVQSSISTQGLQGWLAVASARKNTIDFQTNVFSQNMDLVDVQSWVHQLATAQVITAAQKSEFDQAFTAARVYFDGSSTDVSGLMMYFPQYSLSDKDLLSQYAAINYSTVVKNLVSSYVAFARGNEMPRVTLGDSQASAGAVSATFSISYGALKASSAPEQMVDGGYAVLVNSKGVAVAAQQATVQGSTVSLAQPNVWPTVGGQLITLLPYNGNSTSTFTIPVQTDGENGMLYATKESDGKLHIRYFIASDEVAGRGLAVTEVEAGQTFKPLRLAIVNGEVVSVAYSSTAASGMQVYMTAIDLTGTLNWSPKSVMLPVAQ